MANTISNVVKPKLTLPSSVYPQNTLGTKTTTPATKYPTYTTGPNTTTGLMSATTAPKYGSTVQTPTQGPVRGLVSHTATPTVTQPPAQTQGDSLMSSFGPAKTPQEMMAAGAATDHTATATPEKPLSYGGLVGDLAKFGTTPSSAFTDSLGNYKEAVGNLSQFQQNLADTFAANKMNPIALPYMQGRDAAIQQANASKLEALQGAVQSSQKGIELGQAQQGLEQSAITGAAGFAQPQLGAYGQTFYSPLGGGSAGGDGGGALNPINNIPSLADAVINGQMSPSQAFAQGGSVQNFQGLLTQAIMQKNPAFNFNQAEVNANTQGAMVPQGNLASRELSNLQDIIGKVPEWQATGVPAVNYLSNLFSGLTGVGLQSRQELTNAVNAVRGSVATALGTAYNTTPTSFTAMVNEWFPANPTPAQVQAGVNQFNTLMSARAEAFGVPGNTTLNTNSGSNASLFNW